MNANQAREARALHVQSAQYGRVKNWFQKLRDLASARLPADLVAPFSESKLNWKPKSGFSFDEPDSSNLPSSQTRFRALLLLRAQSSSCVDAMDLYKRARRAG